MAEIDTPGFPHTENEEVAKLYIAWQISQRYIADGTVDEQIEARLERFERAYKAVDEATKNDSAPVRTGTVKGR